MSVGDFIMKDIICTTMDLKCDYEIIGIVQGFDLENLKHNAGRENADGIIGLRISGGKGERTYYGTMIRFVK